MHLHVRDARPLGVRLLARRKPITTATASDAARGLRIAAALRRAETRLDAPVKQMPQRDPFRVLVSAVLSTRTQDSTTAQAANRLFRAAPEAQQLARVKTSTIERLIYPVGFYHTKAKLLPELAGRLVALGRVPSTMDELLELPGVGRKVANIVLANAFRQDVIPVDTHVHRISNRLGLVRTRTPEQTEQALMRILPRSVWREWNYLLVVLGQTICRPVGPKCGECPILRWCEQVGVRSRNPDRSEVRNQRPKTRSRAHL